MMRTLLIVVAGVSMGLAGCTMLDQNAASTDQPAMTGADASANPGSGPGAQPTSGVPAPNPMPH